MAKVFMIDPLPLPLIERLRAGLPIGAYLDVVASLSQEDFAEQEQDAEVLLAGRCRLDARLPSLVRRIRFIQRVGVGTDDLDPAALQAAGVPAAYSPRTYAAPVAEHAILLMLTMRRMPYAIYGSRMQCPE